MIGAIIGNGLYGNHVFGMQNSAKNNSAKSQEEEQKQALIDKNYNDIYTHELAHKTAGGHLAGAIVIERNADGIPFAGHVAIKMPHLNQENPQQTINDANTVIRSAMAPADPSGQDYRVAAQAREIKAQAENLQSKQRLNLLA